MRLARAFVPLACLALWSAVPSASDATAADKILAVVNGTEITEGDLQFMFLSRGVPEKLWADYRESFVETLIDRTLMRAYLARIDAQADADQLELQVQRLHELIRRNGDEPDAVLARLGFDEERLREELSLPLAWDAHVRLAVSNDQIRRFFEEYRSTFDGTRVRARQILLKLPEVATPQAIEEKKQQLRQIAAEIKSGETTFAEAAQKHSAAPSARDGGELGWFTYRGRMPRSLTTAAFALEPGEIGEPFATQFGVHLLQVTEREPGQLSLEDARPQVVERLSESLWNEIVDRERRRAQIERK